VYTKVYGGVAKQRPELTGLVAGGLRILNFIYLIFYLFSRLGPLFYHNFLPFSRLGPLSLSQFFKIYLILYKKVNLPLKNYDKNTGVCMSRWARAGVVCGVHGGAANCCKVYTKVYGGVTNTLCSVGCKVLFHSDRHNRHNLYNKKMSLFLCRLLQTDTKNYNLVSAAYVSRHEKLIFRNKKNPKPRSGLDLGPAHHCR
jgi:hypothetical protein